MLQITLEISHQDMQKILLILCLDGAVRTLTNHLQSQLELVLVDKPQQRCVLLLLDGHGKTRQLVLLDHVQHHADYLDLLPIERLVQVQLHDGLAEQVPPVCIRVLQPKLEQVCCRGLDAQLVKLLAEEKALEQVPVLVRN
jgi:hypothetical protein